MKRRCALLSEKRKAFTGNVRNAPAIPHFSCTRADTVLNRVNGKLRSKTEGTEKKLLGESLQLWNVYTVSQKVSTIKLSVTLSNLNRFPNFLHCWKAYKNCYKTQTTLPTSFSISMVKNRYLRHLQYQNLWMNNKVRSNKMQSVCIFHIC